MSFCGVRDRYPDTRAIKYPFDREGFQNSDSSWDASFCGRAVVF
jgi:hypothetical protein